MVSSQSVEYFRGASSTALWFASCAAGFGEERFGGMEAEGRRETGNPDKEQ